jgi:hypothetical protein
MTDYPINRNCMECFPTGVHSYCDVHQLFCQLHIPLQERTVLMNIASKKKADCESFKKILLFVLKIKKL